MGITSLTWDLAADRTGGASSRRAPPKTLLESRNRRQDSCLLLGWRRETAERATIRNLSFITHLAARSRPLGGFAGAPSPPTQVKVNLMNSSPRRVATSSTLRHIACQSAVFIVVGDGPHDTSTYALA